MALVLRLRARGIADTAVLRALETVPRRLFTPHRYADLAWRDVALPIACGQTMPDPTLIARALEALDLDRGQRVLEVGTGSGYATALMAQIAGEVVSYERTRALAGEAGARLASLKIGASVRHGDGLSPQEADGLFDRIIAHGEPPEGPRSLVARLAEGGALIYARAHDGRSRVLVRVRDGPRGLLEEPLFRVPAAAADVGNGARVCDRRVEIDSP